MLALITLSKMMRPWIQWSSGTTTGSVSAATTKSESATATGSADGSDDGSTSGFAAASASPTEPISTDSPQSYEPKEELKLAVERGKRMSSRIPRVIKSQMEFEYAQRTIKTPEKIQKVAVTSGARPNKLSYAGIKPHSARFASGSSGARLGSATKKEQLTGFQMRSITSIEANDTELIPDPNSQSYRFEGGESAEITMPVVRSTRTSRCRMKLAHPKIHSGNAGITEQTKSSPFSSPAQSKCLETPEQGRRFNAFKHKSLTDPCIRIRRSQDKPLRPINLSPCCELINFECCDHKQIIVPTQLINYFSPSLDERYKDDSQPIRLDTISSQTMQRLIVWMEQHRNDDLKGLQKMQPTLANANSDKCSWDERFLGDDVDSVLQLLLAANCLGINPLVEHAMLYFIELIEHRNNAERICMQHITQTLSKLNSVQPKPTAKLNQILDTASTGETIEEDCVAPHFVAASVERD